MWCDFIFESVPNLVFWGLCAMIGALYHKVKSLKEIRLDSTNIKKIPDSIGELLKLKELDIRAC